MEEDITESELVGETTIEVDEKAFERSPNCRKCHKKMKEVLTDFELPGGELTLHLAAFKCEKCGKELLSGKQAQKFEEMLLLLDAVKDQSKVRFERAVNNDGKSFFIRFPKEITKDWTNDMVSEITPISKNGLIIHLHKN